MPNSQKKSLEAQDSGQRIAIRVELVTQALARVPLSVLHFHDQGACVRVPDGDRQLISPGAWIEIALGQKKLGKTEFSLVWETLNENHTGCVQFAAPSAVQVRESERLLLCQSKVPRVLFQDPTASSPSLASAKLEAKVLSVSMSQLVLSLSLSAKHLFPGMELLAAQVDFADWGMAAVDLFIEKMKLADDRSHYVCEVSMGARSLEFIALASRYMAYVSDLPQEAQQQGERFQPNDLRPLPLQVRRLPLLALLSPLPHEVAFTLPQQQQQQQQPALLTPQEAASGTVEPQDAACFDFYRDDIWVARAGFSLRSLAIESAGSEAASPAASVAEIRPLAFAAGQEITSELLGGVLRQLYVAALSQGAPDLWIVKHPLLLSALEVMGFQAFAGGMVLRGEAYDHRQGIHPRLWEAKLKAQPQGFEVDASDFGNAEQGALVGHPAAASSSRFTSWVPKPLRQWLTGGQAFLGRRQRQPLAAVAVSHPLQLRGEGLEKSSLNIDPLWTEQHINATIMLPFLLESYDTIGREKTLAILSEFRFYYEYFLQTSNWVSMAFISEFLRRYGAHGSTLELCRKAGYRSGSREILRGNYYLVRYFVWPKFAFKRLEANMTRFNKLRVFKVLDSGFFYSHFRIYNINPAAFVATEPALKEMWASIFDAYVRLLTGKPAKLVVVKSTFDGDPYCEYIVTWKIPYFKPINVLLGGSLLWGGVRALSVLQSLYFPHQARTLCELAAAALTTAVFFGFRKMHQEEKNASEVFRCESETRSQELYDSKMMAESQQREGFILEKIKTQIQTSDQISNILHSGLRGVCQDFSFQRGCVLLLDEADQFLKTAAIYFADGKSATDSQGHGQNPSKGQGNDPGNELKETGDQATWQFKLDSRLKRQNPTLLSAVFTTGKDLFIADPLRSQDQFNEASRRLFEKLKLKSFAMTCIPASAMRGGSSKRWGVMITDKGLEQSDHQGLKGPEMNHRDLIVLQRVSKMMGIALDQWARIENEIKTRKMFEKFVPAEVIAATLRQGSPRLASESKKIVSMFFDIAGYTDMMNSLSPTLAVQILNDCLEFLGQIVEQHGGVVDKYMADGAYIHWGAVPGTEARPEKAIATAMGFLDQLALYNVKLKDQGLRPLGVRFGISSGDAIVGLVGSSKRLEFTALGASVNRASRLEGVNKNFHSLIAISEELLPLVYGDDRWTIMKNIDLKGFREGQVIAVYGSQKSALQVAA